MSTSIPLSELLRPENIHTVDTYDEFESTFVRTGSSLYYATKNQNFKTIMVKNSSITEFGLSDRYWSLLETLDIPECILMRVLRIHRSEAFKVRSILCHYLMMQWHETIPEDFYTSADTIEFTSGVYDYYVHIIAKFGEHGKCEATLTYRKYGE